MASSGKEKWANYFSTGNVLTLSKSVGGKSASLHSLDGRKITQLDEGTEIVVKKSESYLGHYIVQVKGTRVVGILTDAAVGKPKHKKNSSEDLKLPGTLIKYGIPHSGTYNVDSFSGMKFNSAIELQRSVIKGLEQNSRVSSEIVDVIVKYFKGDLKTIKWGVEVTDSEQNQLGKYLGELIIGLIFLRNENSRGSSVFSKEFLTEPAKSFIVPTSIHFPVDSFIHSTKGTIVPISSKFGAGAKASFFTHIAAKAMDAEHYRHIKNCEFKRIIATFKEYSIDPTKDTKRALYTYGIYKILNIGYNNAPNPIEIYTGVKNNNWVKGIDDVIDTIKGNSWDVLGEDQIKNSLPYSITSFFNRIIAKRLNEDRTSIDEMTRIISGKNFWQANLNIVKWKKGELKYDMVHSSDNKMTIVGDKAAIGDIRSGQGMLNFEIKSVRK